MTETDKRAGRMRRFHERFLVEERVVVGSGKRNLYLIAGALIVLGLTGFFFVLDSVLESDDLSAIDQPIEVWLESGDETIGPEEVP